MSKKQTDAAYRPYFTINEALTLGEILATVRTTDPASLLLIGKIQQQILKIKLGTMLPAKQVLKNTTLESLGVVNAALDYPLIAISLLSGSLEYIDKIEETFYWYVENRMEEVERCAALERLYMVEMDKGIERVRAMTPPTSDTGESE